MRAALVLVVSALALAGCATAPKEVTRAPAVTPAAAASRGVSYGVIIAKRAVAIAGGLEAPAGTAAGGVRQSILAAIGASAASGPATGGETEFIIREEGGGTISVVQGTGTGLRLGERVMIIRGAETRLAPLGQA